MRTRKAAALWRWQNLVVIALAAVALLAVTPNVSGQATTEPAAAPAAPELTAPAQPAPVIPQVPALQGSEPVAGSEAAEQGRPGAGLHRTSRRQSEAPERPGLTLMWGVLRAEGCHHRAI